MSPSPLRSAVRRASAHSSDRWLYAWALGYAAIGAASLLVPLYALSLGADPFVVGALEATAGLAGVPGALLWGRLADRTGGRRAFALVTLAGTGVTLLAFPLVDGLGLLLATNAAFWFLVAASAPVVTLFVIEGAPEREWEARIGLLNAYQRYGWVGGLAVGAVWIGALSVRTSGLLAARSFFVVCGLAALVATPLAFYWLPPAATVAPARLTRSSRAIHRLVAGSGRYVKLVPFGTTRAVVALKRLGSGRPLSRFAPPLRRYFLTAFTFSAAFAAFFGPVPAYLTALGYPPAFVFGFFILSSLASAVAFVPVGRLAGRIHPRSLQLRALVVRVPLFPAVGLVGLLSGFGPRTAAIGAAFALVGLTWAVVAVTGAGLVSRSASRPLRGEALGVYAALSGLGGGIGGLLGGYVAAAAGYVPAFALAGGLVALSAGLLRSTRFAFGVGGSVDAPVGGDRGG
ncbi:MAG: MFS transporter [Haloferacaceae archaeon]